MLIFAPFGGSLEITSQEPPADVQMNSPPPENIVERACGAK